MDRPAADANDDLQRSPALDAMLDAAAETFLRHSYDAASIAMIADSARTTRPTIYKHLGNKPAIYQQCMDRASAHAQNFLLQRYDKAAALSPRDEAYADMRAFFDFAHQHPVSFALIMEQSGGPATKHRDTLVAALSERLAQKIAHRLSIQQNAPAARQLAAMAIGVAVLAARDATHHDQINASTAVSQAAAFVYGGIGEVARQHHEQTTH